jgi:undecaprenyl-diphosphatase
MSQNPHSQHGFRAWLRRADIIVLFALTGLALGLWLFVGIVVVVTDGDIQGTDESILRAFRDPDDQTRPLGPSWLLQAAKDVSALGGYSVLTLIILSVGGFLLLARKYGALLLMLAATLGGWALSSWLKRLFDRPRPTAVQPLVEVASASFPSGHSMISAAVYLTLGALLARLVAKHSLKLYFILVAVVIALLVGTTRVYLGVHYPTDVLGGWSAGLVWALACWLTARYLQHRGAVERIFTPGRQHDGQSTGGDSDRCE